ncbi:hypothetical protein [Mobilicoccus caccae]|nr:hypothetical protein [Mobilicoccus caccae]
MSQPRESEHTARAADATVFTALGRTVTGGPEAVTAVLPTTTAALDGSLPAPAGLAAGAKDQIPARVLDSYRKAESTLASESPACKLPWWLLAGVGKVESDHAAGGKVDDAGTTTVRIVGPRLDGTVVGGTIVRDTDKGALDGDLSFDRGVGPMLLLPKTWQNIGRDGNGDSRPDVSNVDDATLAVGTLLCSADSDLTTPEGLAKGLVKFDDTPTFASEVLPWAMHYRSGAPTAAASSTGSAAPSTTSEGSTPATTDESTPTTTASPTPNPTPTQAGPGFTTQDPSTPPSTTPPAVPARPAPPVTPTPGRTPVPPRQTPTRTAPPPVQTPTRTAPPPAQTPTRTTPPPIQTPTRTATQAPTRTTAPPPVHTPTRTPDRPSTPTPDRTTRTPDRTTASTPAVAVVTPDAGPNARVDDRQTSTPRAERTENSSRAERRERARDRRERNDRADRTERAERRGNDADGPDVASDLRR